MFAGEGMNALTLANRSSQSARDAFIATSRVRFTF